MLYTYRPAGAIGRAREPRPYEELSPSTALKCQQNLGIVDFGKLTYNSPTSYLMCDPRVGRPNPYEDSSPSTALKCEQNLD